MAVSKDLTELVEIDPTRVDGVKNPASGFKFLVIKAASADAVKDVDKKGRVDEAPDVSNAEAVLRLLAELIAAEARELGAGNWDEVCDIEMLSHAASLMDCFRRCESYAMNEPLTKSLADAIERRRAELEVNEPTDTTASKSDDTEVPTTSTETPDTPAPVEKSTDELIAEAVAKAVGEAIKTEVDSREETIKGLRDELTALKSTPLPGGPQITSIAVKATSSANEDVLRFERLAKSTEDRELSRYYEDRAKEAREASK